MTDPQAAQSPTSYPDPLADAVTATVTELLGVATVGLFAGEILVRRRAEKAEQEAARITREAVLPGENPALSPAERLAARDHARVVAARAVADEFADAPVLCQAILNPRGGPEEFDAFATRLVVVARDLDLPVADTLGHARRMPGLGEEDVLSATSVLHARLGWLADPSTAHPWAADAARAARDAALRQRHGANRTTHGHTHEDTGDAQRTAKRDEEKGVVDGEVIDPARRTTRAAAPDDRVEQAVTAVFADNPALAQAIRGATAFDRFADQLITTARDLNLHPADVLRHTATMIDGLGKRDVRSAVAVLHARLGWLVDPATAPHWAATDAQRAHDAAQRTAQSRGATGGPTPRPVRRRPAATNTPRSNSLPGQHRPAEGRTPGRTRNAAYPIKGQFRPTRPDASTPTPPRTPPAGQAPTRTPGPHR